MNNDLREIAIRTDSGDAWENPFSHEDVAQAISTIRYINSTSAKIREGREVYRHPRGRFVVLEFQGRSGKFREAFWPEEVVKDRLNL